MHGIFSILLTYNVGHLLSVAGDRSLSKKFNRGSRFLIRPRYWTKSCHVFGVDSRVTTTRHFLY